MFIYSDPSRAGDPHALPDIEVFPIFEGWPWDSEKSEVQSTFVTSGDGWYYWPCFPGCLPDSEPVGPFDSEQIAIQAARSDQ